jgi:hypothetical protein
MMKPRFLGVLSTLVIVGIGIVWLAIGPSHRAIAQEKVRCLLQAPTGYPDHTNCPECVKDDADKKERSRVGAAGVITQDFSKNDYYVQPPAPLGDGHALKVVMTAPGNIVSVTRGCYGGGCGWTHDVTYQNMGTKTVTWIGWSNTGTNCILSFTITYQ